jgi:hypothetical protein
LWDITPEHGKNEGTATSEESVQNQQNIVYSAEYRQLLGLFLS